MPAFEFIFGWTNEPSPRLRRGCRPRPLLLNRPLQLQRPRRQLRALGLEQKRIQPAAMIDRLERIRGDAQADVAAQGVGDEGDVAQVGQEPALGLDVGVAHRVAHLGALGRQFAAPRHLKKSSGLPPLAALQGAGNGG